MTLKAVRGMVVERLEQGDRGDRGWFVITRVHVALWWIKGIAEYLEARGGRHAIELTNRDYRQLGGLIGSQSDEPGVQLKRHHLLVMDKPLQLLQRPREPRWSEVALTDLGRALATFHDPAEVLEDSLASIRFSQEPWMPRNRAREYDAFDVAVYDVTLRVLEACEGYVDRDEFDLFLSRVRGDREIGWAVEGIRLFRELGGRDRESLLQEVAHRIPGAKRYQNWRDVALHTFSLFSLGTSLVRDGQRLLLTGTWVAGRRPVAVAKGVGELRLPEPPTDEVLLSPPAAPVTNAGSYGESFVAKVLRSQGWEVVFYTNRRGYGFDLWARRGASAILVEVKSSLTTLGTVELTAHEHAAAQHHRQNYFLALVEGLDGEQAPRLRIIQDPAAQCQVQQRAATHYTIARNEWLRAAADVDQ